jgi:hypothetical protein
MNHLGYWDEDDYYRKEGPQQLSRWQKFTQYVLPWLVLAGICFGLYLTMLYGLEAIILISEPLSKGMKEIGL